jgi:hypothetical protein
MTISLMVSLPVGNGKGVSTHKDSGITMMQMILKQLMRILWNCSCVLSM